MADGYKISVSNDVERVRRKGVYRCGAACRALLYLLRKKGQGVARVQFPKHGRKTVIANTMADLSPRDPLDTLPAHGLLTPGADNLEIGLLAYGPPRLTD